MSADNYYTLKWGRDTLKWYVCHGFMSGLEEGIPALRRDEDPGFDFLEEAQVEAHRDWSEYGVIHEGGDLQAITTLDEWKDYLIATIELATSHLEWLNSGD